MIARRTWESSFWIVRVVMPCDCRTVTYFLSCVCVIVFGQNPGPHPPFFAMVSSVAKVPCSATRVKEDPFFWESADVMKTAWTDFFISISPHHSPALLLAIPILFFASGQASLFAFPSAHQTKAQRFSSCFSILFAVGLFLHLGFWDLLRSTFHETWQVLPVRKMDYKICAIRRKTAKQKEHKVEMAVTCFRGKTVWSISRNQAHISYSKIRLVFWHSLFWFEIFRGVFPMKTQWSNPKK